MIYSKEYYKEYRKNHKEKIRESNKKWRNKNPDYNKNYQEKYKKDNPEKIREIGKRYRTRNKEKIKEYRNKNKERFKKYHKKYYQSNREKLIQNSKRYYEKNKDKRNNHFKIRRRKDKNFKIICYLRSRVWFILKHYTKTGKIYSSKKYGIDYKAIIEYLKPFPKNLSNYQIHHIKPLFTFNFVNKDGSTNLKEIGKAFLPQNHKWLTIKEHKEIHKRLNNGS